MPSPGAHLLPKAEHPGVHSPFVALGEASSWAASPKLPKPLKQPAAMHKAGMGVDARTVWFKAAHASLKAASEDSTN